MAKSKYDCTSSKAASSSYIPRCNPPYLRDPVVFGRPGLSLAQPRGIVGWSPRDQRNQISCSRFSCSSRSLSPPSLPFTFSPRYIIIITIIVVTLPSQISYSTFHIQLHPRTGHRRYHPFPTSSSFCRSRASTWNHFTLVLRRAINKTTGIRFRRSN
jgi:hypothetical protein